MPAGFVQLSQNTSQRRERPTHDARAEVALEEDEEGPYSSRTSCLQVHGVCLAKQRRVDVVIEMGIQEQVIAPIHHDF